MELNEVAVNMFERILVPLDGSHLAEAVLPLIERLGEAPNARVILLHVLERSAPTAIHGERHLTSTAEADTYLRDLADRLQGNGVNAEYHAHEAPEGDVARSIVDHAAETGADLIILATHGSGGMRDLLWGSIAQQVLSRGVAPVLLTRPAPDGHAAPFQPQRILVPLDATRAAEAALPVAQTLAQELGAALHLVMVVPTRETLRGNRVAAATLLPAATRAVLNVEVDEARRYLESLADGICQTGVPVTTEVLRGSPLAALAEESSEAGTGLVVAATHGRAGVQAVWAGSVAARLLARTKAPILLLRIVER